MKTYICIVCGFATTRLPIGPKGALPPAPSWPLCQAPGRARNAARASQTLKWWSFDIEQPGITPVFLALKKSQATDLKNRRLRRFT